MNQCILETLLLIRFLLLLPVLMRGKTSSFQERVWDGSINTLLGKVVDGLEVFIMQWDFASKMQKHLLKGSLYAEPGSLNGMRARPVHGQSRQLAADFNFIFL